MIDHGPGIYCALSEMNHSEAHWCFNAEVALAKDNFTVCTMFEGTESVDGICHDSDATTSVIGPDVGIGVSICTDTWGCGGCLSCEDRGCDTCIITGSTAYGHFNTPMMVALSVFLVVSRNTMIRS